MLGYVKLGIRFLKNGVWMIFGMKMYERGDPRILIVVGFYPCSTVPNVMV